MIPESIAACLRIPLYKLYYLDDIEGYSGMSKADLSVFQCDYNSPLREPIIDALKWANKNPKADLTDLLPNLPASNECIHLFLSKVLRSLEEAGS